MILTYNHIIKIAEDNLEERELFIMRNLLGSGIQIGDHLSIVEFMEKYSFEYDVSDILNCIGKFFYLILTLEKNNPTTL